MNKPNFLLTWLGLLCIGAIPAFINYNLSSTSLMHCISISNSKFVIFDSEIGQKVATIEEQLLAADIRLICLMDPNDNQQFPWTKTISENDIAKQKDTRP